MSDDFLKYLKNYFSIKLDKDILKRIEILKNHYENKEESEYFGFQADTLKNIAPLALWFYRHYFRVECFGVENIPKNRVMVIANHGGQLPFDALMLGTAFIVEPRIPRLLRGMVERFSADIPFISTLFARLGQVIGTPYICNSLLNKEEAVLVFPEGVKGISKLFRERYKLMDFGLGFMRVALSSKAPILPVAIIGSEEQAPSIANFGSLASSLGIPSLPVVFPQILPWPLPVKYRLHIGKPLYFKGDGTEDDEDIEKYVLECKKTLANLIDFGLKQRKNIFF